MPAKPKKPNLKAIAARLKSASTADEFAQAVVDVLGFGVGSVQWVEARAIWTLIEGGRMTKHQALQAIAVRLGEHINMASEAMKIAKKQLSKATG